MKLVCGNCGATYDIADDAVPPGGREVQCARCNHVWHQMPAGFHDDNPDALVLEPESEPTVDQVTTEAETTELNSLRAGALPDAAEAPSIGSDVAEILESEAEFARTAREDNAAEASAEASPLESLRRRVAEAETATTEAEGDPAPEEAVVDAGGEAAENAAAPAASAFKAAREFGGAKEEDTPATEPSEPAAEDAPAAPKAAFRKLGASAPKAPEPEATPEPADEPKDEAPAAPPPPIAAPQVKRKRQSLADLSSGGGTAEASAPDPNAPASKPFDLGPAAPEERPEAPSEQDIPTRSVDLEPSEAIASPEVPKDVAAQRVLEELNAMDISEPVTRRSKSGYIAILLVIIGLLTLFYFVSPIIGDLVPAAAPFLDAYHESIDGVIGSLGIDFSQIGDIFSRWLEAI
ncbi:MAG: zinc-ribbon domain-containing protein [Pseudomonadota bacterium]